MHKMPSEGVLKLKGECSCLKERHLPHRAKSIPMSEVKYLHCECLQKTHMRKI